MRALSLLHSVRTDELFNALLDFQRRWIEAAVEVRRRPWGAITRADRFPLVYMANMARVDRAPAGGPEEILADMDDAFDGTPVRFRSVVFEDPQEAFEAQEAFAGWEFRPTAQLAMARVGLPACITNPDVELREVGQGASEEDFREITRTIHEESGYPAEVHRQLYALDAERKAVVGMRDFVAFLKDEPAGTVSLWVRGPYAIVENVATHPRFRMQGVGRTTIFEACRRAVDARCEWTLLTANLFDSPQLMYKTLGFAPIGEIRGFLRE